MSYSQLNSHNRAHVPDEVCAALHLHPGDKLVYEVRGDHTVTLRKAGPKDDAYLKAVEGTLNEWNSDEDDRAYGDL